MHFELSKKRFEKLNEIKNYGCGIEVDNFEENVCFILNAFEIISSLCY